MVKRHQQWWLLNGSKTVVFINQVRLISAMGTAYMYHMATTVTSPIAFSEAFPDGAGEMGNSRSRTYKSEICIKYSWVPQCICLLLWHETMRVLEAIHVSSHLSSVMYSASI